MNKFNPETHFLGLLCKHGHNWNNTGESLRLKSSRDCVTCKQVDHLNRQRIRQAEESISENSSYFLGNLCKLHEYANTGKSVRRKSNGGCISCSKVFESQRKRLPVAEPFLGNLCKRNHEYENTGKTFRSIHRRCTECDRLNSRSERARNYNKQWRKENPEIVAAQWREWNQRHPEAYKESQDRYKSKPDYKERMAALRKRRYEENLERERSKGIIHNKKRKAKKLKNHSHVYTLDDIRQRFQDFDGCCAYCGAIATSIDHWIALKSGGPDVLGNLLPACMTCNPSKGSKDGETWFRSQPFFTNTRWKRIKSVLGISKSAMTIQLPLF